jgi:hypothetical protein
LLSAYVTLSRRVWLLGQRAIGEKTATSLVNHGGAVRPHTNSIGHLALK